MGVRGERPAAVRGRERDAAGDVHGRGQAAGDVGERGQPGLQHVGRRGSGPAGHQVQAVDGELVGLPEDDAEQRDPADDRDRGRAVQLDRLLGQVAGGGLPVAAQRGEYLLAGGVPVGGGDPGVDGVDVGGVPVPPARADAIRSAIAVWSSQQPRCTQISCARHPSSREGRLRSTASACSRKASHAPSTIAPT